MMQFEADGVDGDKSCRRSLFGDLRLSSPNPLCLNGLVTRDSSQKFKQLSVW